MSQTDQVGPLGAGLPEHIETAVRTIADLHEKHRLRATPSERMVELLVKLVARPRFVGAISVMLLIWIGANLAVLALGAQPLDPPPFNGLQSVASVAALYTTVVILIAQRREDQLTELRQQLTLELAILAEQKSAKTIELLESLRRDSPTIPNRVDHQARAMATPANPQIVAEAIEETRAQLDEARQQEDGDRL